MYCTKKKNIKTMLHICDLSALASGKQIIYEAIQLWNYRDKLKADLIENSILEGILGATKELGLKIKKYPIYMPFRDSDEEDINLKDKGRKIFIEDIKRITSSTFAVIGFSDGLAKDSGVFFEYGMAVAQKIPTLLVVSDFFYFSNRYKDIEGKMRDGISYYIDPLVEYALGKVLIKNDLPSVKDELIPTTRSLQKQKGKKRQFRRRLEIGFNELRVLIRKETENLCLDPAKYIKDIDILIHTKRDNYVYIEIEGIHEWQIEKMLCIADELNKVGIPTRIPKRFNTKYQHEYFKKYGKSVAEKLGREDLKTAIGSTLIIINGEGWDVPISSAFLQGISFVQRKPIILYYTGNRQINSESGLEMIVNLMLEYSATKIASSTKQTIKFVKDLILR